MNDNEEFVYDEYVDSFRFRLSKKGKLFVSFKKGDWQERDWFKNEKTGKPWFPKRKNFMSLIKWAVRDGDYDDMKKSVVKP